MLDTTVRLPFWRRLAYSRLSFLMIGASLFCFFGSVFFAGLFPYAGAIRCGSVGVIIFSATVSLLEDNKKFNLMTAGVLALCFMIFILFNRGDSLIQGSDRTWFLFFASCMLVSFLLRGELSRWLEFSAKLIAIFALIHATATVVFFVIPNLYTGWFKPCFYASVYTANGYKAGLSNHYSTNAMYLAWGLITSFYFWQASEQRASRKWQIVAIVIFIAILLTTKRAHLVFGLASCLVVYLLLNHGKGFGAVIKMVSFAICVLVVFCIAAQFVPELAGVVDRIQGAKIDEGRSSYYGVCLDLFASSPFLGHGWGSFTAALYQSGVSDVVRLIRQGNLSQNAHNVYLQLLAEEGLVGFLLFMSFAISALGCSVRSALTSCRNRDGSRGLYALSGGVQVFFLLYCITGNPLYDLAEYTVYLLLGVAPSLLLLATHSRNWRS